MLAELVFSSALGLIVYHHVGYPLLVRAVLAARRDDPAQEVRENGFRPSVTIIVPVHNEAAVIADKIRNLAAIDYPRDRLRTIIALDGCSDATRPLAEAALREATPGTIVLAEYQPNVGKVAVLNDQIARIGDEVVALTDASAMIAPDALLRAASRFADPTVGVVTGRYLVTDLDHRGESAYWHYQSDLRAGESALAGPVGAHGAFYLFRRSAWTPLPPDTINDDFVLPMSIVLKGLRAVFAPDVVATEVERSKSRQEFRRRVRIGAGNLQQTLRMAGLADPRRGWVAFAFLSGKGLRGVLPFLFLAVLLSSAVLAMRGSAAFAVLVVLEAAGVLFALFGGRIPRIRETRLPATILYLLEGYLALAVGAAFVLLGREGEVWRLSKAFDRAA